MTVKILCIGDPHFKQSNIPEVELFIERMTNLAIETEPDLIVILGDLLDEHERIHTIPLNKAYEFVNKMRAITKTYVLVGNHDMINHLQFLTENHWMNGMKEWMDVTIVDKTLTEIIKGEKLVFLPYVAPGRFIEALNTLEEGWKDASIIFPHQEFFGCKMGAIVSEEGDKWDLDYPNIVSGHIHLNQTPQENVYYPGSSMQHAFGESEKNIIAFLKLKDKEYELEEIDLKLPRKKIVYMDVDTADDYTIPEKSEDKIKVSISGVYEEFKTFKKTKKYKELINKGIKVVFKPKRSEQKMKNESLSKIIDGTKTSSNFKEIITDIIASNKDPYLFEVFEFIINDNVIGSDDIIFLE